jgi:hypothetical protein
MLVLEVMGSGVNYFFKDLLFLLICGQLGVTIFYPQFGSFRPDMGEVVSAASYLDTVLYLKNLFFRTVYRLINATKNPTLCRVFFIFFNFHPWTRG